MPSLVPTQPFGKKLICHWPGNHTSTRDCKPWSNVNFRPFKGNSIVLNLAICHWVFVGCLLTVVSSELHSTDRIGRQGKKDQRPSSNSGPTLYRGVSPVLKGDWGRRVSTGIDGSLGWNSAIERRSRVLVLFPLSPCPVWAVEFTTTTI